MNLEVTASGCVPSQAKAEHSMITWIRTRARVTSLCYLHLL